MPGGGRLRGGGHWTRDVAFSHDGKTMFVSVGSHSNIDDTDNDTAEIDRADMLEFNPDGTASAMFASGIRNPVGIAVHPRTRRAVGLGQRARRLGDNLVPDYITRVKEGGFYGWPWYLHRRQPGSAPRRQAPRAAGKVIVPDVLLQPHNASLQLIFYDGKQFPADYRGDIFAAQHGSWNRADPHRLRGHSRAPARTGSAPPASTRTS